MSKPAATLTSSLLALKGRASTAGFTPPPEPPLAPPPAASVMAGAGSSDEAVQPLLKAREVQPLPPRKRANGVKRPARDTASAGGPGAPSVRLSYRMAPSEHRRFALLAAHLGKSKQQVIDEALAAYMARHGSEVAGGTCACLQPSRGADGVVAGRPVAFAVAAEME